MKKLRLIYFLLLLGPNITLKAQTAFASEEELKKQASKLFEEERFEEAYPLYTQLTSNYPKDPNYNYRIGVCMLYSVEDKEQPISYLEFASKKPNVDEEVFFYLAKAYHLNYRFDDAIKMYQNYKKAASSSKADKLQVDHQIEMCRNGKKLLRNLSDLVVIDKKELNRTDFFRAYDVSDIGGKLLVKPDEDQFKSALDKKKKESSIIYLSANNSQIYFSSYGTDPDRGKDIFIIRKLPSGEWSQPQTLGHPVNTEYDEDFPFLHPNGKVLYFCSKGHNSMGGYDIFKTILNEETDTWNKPVNMDFPINTPDDDILYVTNADEKEAYFASARSSATGKTAVYHIKSDRRAVDKAIIKGTLVQNRDDKPKDVKITVKDMKDNSILGIYNSKSDGSYFISVPNGGQFLFTVEAQDFTTQSEIVNVPVQNSFTPLKQELSYEPGTDKLMVKNMFDQTSDSDEKYLEVLSLIKEKSKMEVNVHEVADNTIADNSNQTTTPSSTSTSDAKKPVSLSNDDIVKIAYDDAKEAEGDAKEAREQADIALNLANQKNELAQNKTTEARKLAEEAAVIADPAQKQAAVERSNTANKEAELLNDATVVAFNLVKKLEKNAVTKQQEADLSLKYAKDLEAAVKAKSSSSALAQLDEQKQKLETLSAENTGVNDLSSSLKIDSDNKQRELNKAVQTSADIKQEIADNITLIENVQADADKTKNEQLKKGLLDQIAELKQENIDKQKELEENEAKVARLQKEFNGIQNETELVNAVIDRSRTETGETAKASVASIDKNKLEQQVNSIQNEDQSANNPVAPTNTQNVTDTLASVNNTDTKEQAKVDTEAFVKINQKYGEDLAAAEKIENPADREEVKADVLKTWSEAINTEVEKQKQNAGTITDPEIKELLANSINDAEKLSQEKQSQANESLVRSETLKKQQDLAQANNATVPSDTTAENKQNSLAITAPDTVSQVAVTAPATVSNDVPVIKPVVDTQALATLSEKYDEDIASIEKIENVVERENAKAEVLKKWSQEIDAEVSKQKQAFLTATDPETKTILANSISDAQKLSEEKQALANASLAKAETYKQENTLAVTPVATAPSLTTDTITQEQSSTTTTDSFTYTTTTSRELAAKADELVKQAVDLETQSNQLKMKVETLADINDRNEVYEQAEQLSKQSESKKIEAAEIVGSVNKAEFTVKQAELEQFARMAVNNSADDVLMAEMLKDEAKIYFNKAEKLRGEAAATNSYYTKETALEEAYANEMIALEKQKKAQTIYRKYGDNLAVNTSDQQGTTAGRTFANNQNTAPKPVNSDSGDTLYLYSKPPLVKDSATNDSLPSLGTIAGNKPVSTTTETPASPVEMPTVPTSTVTPNALVTTTTDAPSTTTSAENANRDLRTGAPIALETTEVFERRPAPVYSAAKPIPVNEKLPEGLIFKVQIGAFRNPIPQDLFQGMTPVTGETTPQGFIRYTAGIFVKYPTADQVKNEIRDLGYKDAFVVAFLNGKRIPMNEALKMAGIDPATVAQNNQPANQNTPALTGNVQNNAGQPVNAEIARTENVTSVNGLFYTVQIGVYSQPVTASRLFNVQPLYSETTSGGMIRYNTGIYDNIPRASEAKNMAINAGIKDAFVTAYRDGKRVSLSEAALLVNQGQVVFATAPNMNVLPVFGRGTPGAGVIQPGPVNQAVNPIVNNTETTDLTNIQQPASSLQGNQMPLEPGVVFKIQIGAYKDQVPIEMANKFLSIAGKGINNYRNENGLTIYTVGNFKTYDEANKLKSEITAQGLNDAFIIAYRDGKKISVEEAKQLTNK